MGGRGRLSRLWHGAWSTVSKPWLLVFLFPRIGDFLYEAPSETGTFSKEFGRPRGLHRWPPWPWQMRLGPVVATRAAEHRFCNRWVRHFRLCPFIVYYPFIRLHPGRPFLAHPAWGLVVTLPGGVSRGQERSPGDGGYLQVGWQPDGAREAKSVKKTPRKWVCNNPPP